MKFIYHESQEYWENCRQIHDSRSWLVATRCHSHEEEKKLILGTRLKSFCTGNIVDDVPVIRSFSVSHSAVCSLQTAVCGLWSVVCSLWSAVCGLRSAVCKCQTPLRVRSPETSGFFSFKSA